jgi:hypothetical protein
MSNDPFVSQSETRLVARVQAAILRSPATITTAAALGCTAMALMCFRETKADLGSRYVTVEAGGRTIAVKIDAYEWQTRLDGSMIGRSKSASFAGGLVSNPLDAELIDRYHSAPLRWWSPPRW